MACYLPTAQLLALISTVVVIIHQYAVHRGKARLPLPPGPQPLPLLGNMFDIPKTITGREYHKLSEKHGEVVHLKALSQSMIVIASYRLASELLDKRSSNFSDRPGFVMPQLIGDWILPYNGYTDIWRRRRKEFHHHFGPGSVGQYHIVQEDAALHLVQLLLAAPESYADHVKFVFGSTILRIVYGIKVSSPSDEISVLEQEAMRAVKEALTPGKYLVEALPFLRHLPAWFPGAGFKTEAEAYKQLLQETRNRPFDVSLQSMSIVGSGNHQSIVSAILEKAKANGKNATTDIEDIARDVCGASYLGALETGVATLYSFIYAMALHPDVQIRAQAELDAVVGPSRLPLLNDRPALPYVDAVLSEVLRWLPAVPLCVPHSATTDGELDGYLIPAKAVIFPNVWAMARDPEYYSEPEHFVPERFLSEDGQLRTDILNPRSYVFGFGRRICPGMQYSEATLFITFARILHALVIERANCDSVPDRAIPSSDDVNMKEGFISHPELLQYTFKARSPGMETLVLASRED